MSPLLRSGGTGKPAMPGGGAPKAAAQLSVPTNNGAKKPVVAQVTRSVRKGVGKVRGANVIVSKDIAPFSRQMAAMLLSLIHI